MKDIYENIKPILALIIVIFTYIIFALILTLFQKDMQIVSQVVIAVVGSSGVAIGYYFGSSQGLSQANDTIANSASNPLIQNSESTIVK